jgi:epoxyqueuosine reductase
MRESLRPFIETFIEQRVASADTITRYRRPLVGFASAADPMWERLKAVAEPTHLLPEDLLPGARTVIAFFVPFDESVADANRRDEATAREWAIAYTETNRLINRIADELKAELAVRGVRSAGQPSTHNWNPETLVSAWSHKSAAAIAGLGSFGLHRMLITDLGCAGRCGSLVIDAALDPTSRRQVERCLYFHDGSCGLCVEAFPAGALRIPAADEMNLDKFRCYDHILHRATRHLELPESADCCGKCATAGPCALGSAVR